MKYYLHDTNAFNDEKISELFLHYGYEGLGLFYTVLERIAMQEKPIKTEVLKAQLKVGKKLNKCWTFMESIGLICSNNGETFNEQLLNFSEKYQIKKEKNKERVSQWRENQSSAENVTHYESVRNTPKVNISKVNESKVNNEPKGSVETDVSPTTEDLKNLYAELPKTSNAITPFIRTHKPTFCEPYSDLWNLFASKYSKPKVETLNDTRRKKISIRAKEESFDFVQVLAKATSSDMLLEGNWFAFDWVIENHRNYLKVLEGNYDNGIPSAKEQTTGVPTTKLN